MKKYSISYIETIIKEAIVKAKNREEALRKVREILPDIDFENIWEIRESNA